jgi:site-specific DNA-cytosine methylase
MWIVGNSGRKSTSSGINSSTIERSKTIAPTGAMDAGDASCSGTRSRSQDVADANGSRCQQQRRPITVQTKQLAVERCDWWSVEPELGRVANGIPARVDRLRCLGNAVVPQVVEVIGRAIMQAEEMIGRDSATTQQQRSE